MRVSAWIILLGLLSRAAFSQASPPAFETADIHPSVHVWNPHAQGGLDRGGRAELHQATMLDLITMAYGVDPDTVFGGPAWLDWDRFDVVATTPPSTSDESAKLMLQTLLADRFQLVVHRDTRPMPADVLTVGQGKPRMKEAEDSGIGGCQAQPPPKPGPDVIPYITATCRNVTMEAFAATLRALSAEYIHSPVVDSTGLKGAWDFDIKWTPKGPLAAGRGGISLPDALEKQVGLRLQAQRLPIPVLVVDRVNRKPTGSWPGMTAGPPSATAVEFEVAAIKPSLPEAPPTPPHLRQVQRGGRLYWRSVPLRDLITQAWDLDPDPHAPIAGAPKWLDSARFDLVAKAPAVCLGTGGQVFSEDLRSMLRALLVDRFKMVTHYEELPVDVYTLVAAKPKLKTADPSNRPRCRIEPPQPPGEPGTGPPPQVVVCRNVTMSDFAERLQNIARSYLRYPVQDETGIEGAWDFTLSFHPVPPPDGGPGRGMPKGGPPPPDRGPAGDAQQDDPTSRITLFVAIEKELGLKLQTHKRTMPVLVIDHIEKRPTEN
jgi:uncharacterized protein (TIGR03435 family)